MEACENRPVTPNTVELMDPRPTFGLYTGLIGVGCLGRPGWGWSWRPSWSWMAGGSRARMARTKATAATCVQVHASGFTTGVTRD